MIDSFLFAILLLVLVLRTFIKPREGLQSSSFFIVIFPVWLRVLAILLLLMLCKWTGKNNKKEWQETIQSKWRLFYLLTDVQTQFTRFIMPEGMWLVLLRLNKIININHQPIEPATVWYWVSGWLHHFHRKWTSLNFEVFTKQRVIVVVFQFKLLGKISAYTHYSS
jgi:hypothetical protein